jgi:exosortase/archaeosortase family protein
MLHSFTAGKNPLLREGVRFILIWASLSAILWIIFQPFEIILQEMTRVHVQAILHAIGTNTSSQTTIQFWAENKLIEISPLCAGLVEMILLASAMAAAKTVSHRKKVLGIILGMASLYVFNVLRIVFTVQQLVHTNLEFAEFTHDVFFRLVLLTGFAAIYWAWLNVDEILLRGRVKGLFA